MREKQFQHFIRKAFEIFIVLAPAGVASFLLDCMNLSFFHVIRFLRYSFVNHLRCVCWGDSHNVLKVDGNQITISRGFLIPLLIFCLLLLMLYGVEKPSHFA